MTLYWAQWNLKSPAFRLFTQPFVQAQIKEDIKAPRTDLCEGINRWPLNSRHKGPATRKILLLRPCNANDIWWGNTGLILGLRPGIERRRYEVTPSLTGWPQTKNYPCNIIANTTIIHSESLSQLFRTKYLERIQQFSQGLSCLKNTIYLYRNADVFTVL